MRVRTLRNLSSVAAPTDKYVNPSIIGAQVRQTVFVALILYSFAIAGSDRVPGQWIAIRKSNRATWNLSSTFRHRLLDQDGNMALLHSRARPDLGEDFFVQPNFHYYSSAADPDLEKSWGLKNTGQMIPDLGNGIVGKDIGAELAWNLASNASPVTVAVLDSGIDLAHEEFLAQLWSNVDGSHGKNFIKPNSPPQDDNGHGTFCSGIIAASPNNGKGTRGVAPNARVMVVKMLDAQGTGTSADAVAAIEYAVQNGAQIINASWGGSQFDAALYDAVRRAGDRGVLFIAASGNDGKDNDHDSKPTFPASFRLSNIISVAAYDNKDALAKFSNFGKETVLLGAPGVAIYSTGIGGYRFGDGTSFAAPFVSGTAALVKGVVPSLTLQSLKDRLLWTSEPIHYYERERTETGGRLHAGNAVRDFRPVRPATPNKWEEFSSSSSTLHPYVNKTVESYRFFRPGASHVRVHFQKFDTESCCDKVVLKDTEGNVITEYKGSLGDFWSADALGDTLTVEFTSDFSMTAYGFDIDAYGIVD